MVRRTIGRHDLSTVEGQSRAVADALPIIEGLADPVRRSEYAHLVADLAGVNEASVVQALDERRGGAPAEVAADRPRRMSARERVEREMLKLIVRDPAVFEEYGSRLSDDHFRSAAARKAFAALRESNGDVAPIAAGDDEKLAALVSSLAVEPLDGDGSGDYVVSVWSRLQELVLKQQSDTLRMQLQKLNPITDEGYDELFAQLVEVDGELRRLRQSIRSAV
jgi:DNA primase